MIFLTLFDKNKNIGFTALWEIRQINQKSIKSEVFNRKLATYNLIFENKVMNFLFLLKLNNSKMSNHPPEYVSKQKVNYYSMQS